MIFHGADDGGTPFARRTKVSQGALLDALLKALNSIAFLEARLAAKKASEKLGQALLADLPTMPELVEARECGMKAASIIDTFIAAEESEHGPDFIFVLVHELFRHAEEAQRAAFDRLYLVNTLRTDWPDVFTEIFGADGWTAPVEMMVELADVERAKREEAE